MYPRPDFFGGASFRRGMKRAGLAQQPSRLGSPEPCKGGRRMGETIDEGRLNQLVGKVIGDVAGAMGVFMA